MKQIDCDVELGLQLSQEGESEVDRDWKVLTD
jgi:hypothetical protein